LVSRHLVANMDRQLPRGDEIFLDHIGHFVHEPQAAAEALRRAGFAPTPVSVQADPAGTPTGTGNVTAMFTRGYMEVLFKTANTEIGREFEAAIGRRPGVHLMAFSVADAERAHGRLSGAGFKMRPLVDFSRPVETESGAGTAAFTVVRLERGEMAEGRIQMLVHRTEDTVWQKRWLAHPNGATGLVDVMIAVADVNEAARRFARFTDREAKSNRAGQILLLDRGAVQLVNAQYFVDLLPEVATPSLSFIGAYGLAVKSLATAERALRQGGIAKRRIGGALAAKFPDELGIGAWLFVEQAADLPWRG
jgi:glyoxalase-like protein